jgi:hypothetical protein
LPFTFCSLTSFLLWGGVGFFFTCPFKQSIHTYLKSQNWTFHTCLIHMLIVALFMRINDTTLFKKFEWLQVGNLRCHCSPGRWTHPICGKIQICLRLKGTLHEISGLKKWLGQMKFRAPDKPKIFSLLVAKFSRYSTFRAFRVFSEFIPIHSVYSQYAYILILHGGSMVARLTVVLQSRNRIRRLLSPQLTANLSVGCHLWWHLAIEKKIMRNELLVRQKHIKKKNIFILCIHSIQTDSFCVFFV